MNYSALKTEISTDPLAIGYAKMTDDQVAASLNTSNRAAIASVMVNARTAMQTLGATKGAAFLDALENAAASTSPVKWAMYFLKSDSGVDVGDPQTRGQLDALAAAGVLNQADVTTIKALAETTISRAHELGLPVVMPWQVDHARGQ